MANVIKTVVIDDGPRNLITKTSFVLDTADMAETVIQDPATAFKDQQGTLTTLLALKVVRFMVPSGLILRLQWKAATNTEAAALQGAQELHFDCFGFIHNDATAPNGQLVAITNGWTAGTLSGFFVVESVKVNG